MSDIHDLVVMDLHSFTLAIQAKPWNVYFYKTNHDLSEVLEPGYFNEAIENQVRKNDRIEVTANADGAAQFATLVVRSVVAKGVGKSVVVSKLERE